ncbi:MAG: protein kinase [Proteobacteria bacterium]|nr:protein kinase [Pseudomonadota bacterium]
MKQKILVIEDEAQIRINITLMLKGEGYEVSAAENGRRGVEVAREFMPDLVLCDVMMPELDGFGVLDALRADGRFADLPFVFLTALDDRASMRRGMNLGADDYLTKPFTRDDLLETVGSRFKRHAEVEKVFESRLTLKVDELQHQFADKLAGKVAPLVDPASDPLGRTGRMLKATVLFSDIRNFTTYSERLSAGDTALLLNTYFERACQPILAQGGRITKLLGDGVMVMFEATEADPNHARRALRAGLGIALVAYRFRDWVHQHHGKDILPEFSVGSGIHTGEVIMCRVGAPGSQEWTVIGDSVNVASRLEGQTKTLGWVVVASRATVEAAGPGVTQGAAVQISLRGRSEPVSVVEVIGMEKDGETTSGTVVLPESVRDALRANATNTAEAAKGALNEALHLITSQISGPQQRPLSIAGYRIVAKIGEGGMSSVFLVKRESDDADVALKIVSATDNEEMIERFMLEAQILSSIDHPNVVKIYDQGFGKEYAYIAMEYFTGGTLSDLIKEGLSPRQAMSLLAQAAGALREIHRRGIIHRDIKPANMMVRADGSIALVDFGVARLSKQSMDKTQHGVVFGTPYYLSPEQASGTPAVEASDIYSLGIIFYEMLTQKRPYTDETVVGILNKHTFAPVPRLPEDLAGYQDLLDHMMAKKLADRYPNADALLDAIDALWTKIAVATAQMTSR